MWGRTRKMSEIGLTPEGPLLGPAGYEINLLYIACLVALIFGGAGLCRSMRCELEGGSGICEQPPKQTYLAARSNRRYADYSISATSWLRLLTSSLRKMAWRCFFTIGKLKQAPSAISWLLRPSQTSRATSCSRLVSRMR
jgi:hypothetical protein